MMCPAARATSDARGAEKASKAVLEGRHGADPRREVAVGVFRRIGERAEAAGVESSAQRPEDQEEEACAACERRRKMGRSAARVRDTH